MLPNFLGIGAQRCATSWIYECLREHPQIFMPETKELRFFTHQYHRGLGWYESQFPEQSDHQLRGEFSPGYLFNAEAAPRIKETLGNSAKFIVSLRNPVTRAFSQYKQELRADLVSGNFYEALQQRPEYLLRGLYYDQVKTYLESFDREQFIFVLYEQIEAEPEQVISRIYEFLGVDDSFSPRFLSHRRNRGVTGKRGTLKQFLIRFLDRMANYRIPSKIWNSVKHYQVVNTLLDFLYGAQGDKNSLDEDMNTLLTELFRTPNRKLEKLIGLPVTDAWDQRP